MIKYINLVEEQEQYRRTQNSPTHKLVVVYENGNKQYIGAVWYSREKGFGSIKLNDGVSFSIPEDFKIYEPKLKKVAEEETIDNDIKKSIEDYYPKEDINPEEIPF